MKAGISSLTKSKYSQSYNINRLENFIVPSRNQFSQFGSESAHSLLPWNSQPLIDYSLTSSFISFGTSVDCELFNQNTESPITTMLEQVEEGQFQGAVKISKEIEEDFKRLKYGQTRETFYEFADNAQLAHQCYQLEDAWGHANEAKAEKDRIGLDDYKFDLFYYILKGRVFLYRRIFTESLEAFEQAKEILKSKTDLDEKELFLVNNNIAKLHYCLEEGDCQMAKTLLEESLEYGIRSNDADHKALCHLQLSDLYLNLRDTRKVRTHLKECTKAAKQITDKKQRYLFFARIRKFQGELNFIMGDQGKGKYCYERALDHLRKIFPQKNILSEIYSVELKRYLGEEIESNTSMESFEIIEA